MKLVLLAELSEFEIILGLKINKTNFCHLLFKTMRRNKREKWINLDQMENQSEYIKHRVLT